MQKLSKISRYIFRNWWGIIFLALFVPGVIVSVEAYRFTGGKEWNDAVYQTLRLFQVKNNPEITEQLTLAKWLLCLSFFWLSFKVFITIVAPHFLTKMYIRLFCHNHVIICGLNEISLSFIKENTFGKKQIIVIADKNNPFLENVKQRNISVIFGNPIDRNILSQAGVIAANYLYAITNDDTSNIKIAQNTFTFRRENGHKIKDILKCFTLIQDGELKSILEETNLFKHVAVNEGKSYFDGILFNINEHGIKYGISKNIRKILPRSPEHPNILIIGLSDKAEKIILDLSHVLTMERKSIRFTIIEDNQLLVNGFELRYPYLKDFVEFEYRDSINTNGICDEFSSVFICHDSQIESIKKSMPVRCALGKNHSAIFVLCDNSEDLSDVLNAKGDNTLSFAEKNIFLMNLFDSTVNYIINLDADIETMAENAHNLWREKDKITGEYLKDDRYETISEHFKQSNRNAVLDNYIKLHLVRQKAENEGSQNTFVNFSEMDKETLAMMEHRRWMIEKYRNGWRSGEIRNNHLKVHTELKPWKDLSEKEKMKDYKIIDLLISEVDKQQV